MQLREKFLKRNTAVRGQAVNFRIDTVQLPNKKKAVREYLDHPGAVAVIALVDPTHLILVQQFRYPVGQVTWEIPAGKLNRGEKALPCVKRELEEETGCRAKRIERLLSFWPTAAFANEIIHLFVARGLTQGEANPDDDEFLRTRVWSLKDAARAVQKGRIKDSKTIIALLAFKAFG